MNRSLILGGMAYGDTFLDILEKWCLPSLNAPENRAALQDAIISLFTDVPSEPRLRKILGDAGVRHELRVLPEHVIAHEAGGDMFCLLAAVQTMILRNAAERGIPFHMFMPDQVYSERYFPRLFALAEKHGDIVHNGLNVHMDAAAEINRHRKGNALCIPADAMGRIAWQHLHERMSAYLMNNAKSEAMPGRHFQLWRAQDRLMLFSVHNNPAFLTPRTAQRLPDLVDGTMDMQTRLMVGGKFKAPTLEDDMMFFGIERAEAPPTEPTRTWNVFIEKMWGEVLFRHDLLNYIDRPTMECHAPLDGTSPSYEAIMEWQGRLAAEMAACIELEVRAA